MLDYQTRTTAEILKYSNDTWGQGITDPADSYLDAMQNGEYHEERPGLTCLASRLSRNELANLFVPVSQALVSCSVESRKDSDGLAILMKAHNSLVNWSRCLLGPEDDLLGDLVAVRELIVAEIQQRGFSFLWCQVLEQLRVVEAGVYLQMGMRGYELESAYDSLIYRLEGR